MSSFFKLIVIFDQNLEKHCFNQSIQHGVVDVSKFLERHNLFLVLKMAISFFFYLLIEKNIMNKSIIVNSVML